MTVARPGAPDRPLLLLVGGGSGLVGRALLDEFRSDHQIRSMHRRPSAREIALGVEVLRADVALVNDWSPYLEDVDLLVNVAWYRGGSDRRFRPLASGLERMFRAASAAGIRRVVHLSVPPAPPALEAQLPYLVRKREVDAALARSDLDYSILTPTMLWGPGDRLLTVMLRTIARWHRLPMFGDGDYHVSPLAAADLARIVRREAGRGGRTTVPIGGPRRWTYRELTDRLFAALGRSPVYLHWSPTRGRRIARLLEAVGSTLLYAYEVDWLVSDRLGLPAYVGLEP
ncbi:NAD-dependent epimerase/dehydratase, partial [mine drainage metagenome]